MESFRWFGGGINFVCIYIVYDNIINCYYYYCCCFKCVFESWPWNLDWVASLQSEATSSVVQLALPRPKNFINDINCHRQGLLLKIRGNKSSKYSYFVNLICMSQSTTDHISIAPFFFLVYSIFSYHLLLMSRMLCLKF